MKILLMSIGTRGDCEPFLGVGEMLRDHGEDVVCAFPEQYRKLAIESGFPFHSLGSEFLDLLESDVGRIAMGGDKGGFQKTSALLKLSKKSIPIQKKMIDLQHEIVKQVQPDCIIFHPKVTYPLPWSLKTGGKIVMLSTVPCMIHEVKGLPHVGINKNLGGLLNPLTYKLVNSGTASAIMIAVKKYFNGEFTQKRIRQELLKMKLFYAVSPTIFPRPVQWKENAIVAGFWERNKSVNWTPEPDLLEFIEKHQKILFITFGSMVNSDPAGKTALFLEVLKQLEIPAIINISGGGFAEASNYNRSQVHFVKYIPYDWVFPKVYAVIHHGGAGTTHSALKAGCATMAVPHTADQPMWDAFIEKLGVGPKGIPLAKLEKENLADKLLELLNNPSYKEKAEELAEKMQQENFTEELYRFITD